MIHNIQGLRKGTYLKAEFGDVRMIYRIIERTNAHITVQSVRTAYKVEHTINTVKRNFSYYWLQYGDNNLEYGAVSDITYVESLDEYSVEFSKGNIMLNNNVIKTSYSLQTIKEKFTH